MTSHLLFDTSVLPRSGQLRDNPLFSATLHISRILGIVPAISEIALAEAVEERRRVAESALEKLRSALKAMDKAFTDESFSVYLPASEEAAEAWQGELSSHLAVIPLDGEHAIKALHREARRLTPARATGDGSATGARDAAIWLNALQVASSNAPEHTYFVTNNTRYFSDPNEPSRLHPQLINDMQEAGVAITYLTRLSGVLQALTIINGGCSVAC